MDFGTTIATDTCSHWSPFSIDIATVDDDSTGITAQMTSTDAYLSKGVSTTFRRRTTCLVLMIVTTCFNDSVINNDVGTTTPFSAANSGSIVLCIRLYIAAMDTNFTRVFSFLAANAGITFSSIEMRLNYQLSFTITSGLSVDL